MLFLFNTELSGRKVSVEVSFYEDEVDVVTVTDAEGKEVPLSDAQYEFILEELDEALEEERERHI